MIDPMMMDALQGFGFLGGGMQGLIPQLQQMQPLQHHPSLFGSVANVATGGLLGTKPSGGGLLGGGGGGLLGFAQTGAYNAPFGGNGMVTFNGGFGGVNPYTGRGFGSMAPGGQAQYPGGYQAPQDTLNLPF